MNDDLKQLAQALAEHKIKIPISYAFFYAAVLVPIVKKRDQLHLLFEVRSGKLHWQPGEICFPGGKIEQTDSAPAAAAVRETCEELGITRDQLEVLGTMDELVSPIGVMLFPAIGYLPDISRLQPNKAEVAELFTVPLDFFLETEPLTATMEMGTRPLHNFPFDVLPDYARGWKRRTTYEVIFYQYGRHVIWGLTAQVLNNFLRIYREILTR